MEGGERRKDGAVREEAVRQIGLPIHRQLEHYLDVTIICGPLSLTPANGVGLKEEGMHPP